MLVSGYISCVSWYMPQRLPTLIQMPLYCLFIAPFSSSQKPQVRVSLHSPPLTHTLHSTHTLPPHTHSTHSLHSLTHALTLTHTRTTILHLYTHTHTHTHTHPYTPSSPACTHTHPAPPTHKHVHTHRHVPQCIAPRRSPLSQIGR